MIRMLSAVALLTWVVPSGLAQTVKTPSDANNAQLAAILERLDRQSQQIEALAREVSRLSNALESQEGSPATARSAQTPWPRPTTAASSGSPTPVPVPADAPPGSQMHTVVKGENLTKISNKYGVSLEEIMKVNKIQDDRKLQIGQNLVIPKKADGTASPTPTGTASPASSPTP